MGEAALIASMLVAAATSHSNFGIRWAPGQEPPPAEASLNPQYSASAAIDMSAVAEIGAKLGVVTSLRRTPERNRAVGGAPNSYHLRGQAIDIARRPGLQHFDVEKVYRSAGYVLVESLDEGDHSHLAFGTHYESDSNRFKAAKLHTSKSETPWRQISAAGALLK